MKKPAKKTKKASAKAPAKCATRTIATISGVKAGDDKLAPQPRVMANIAFELGDSTRAEFLTELAKKLDTCQPIGRLFSFHKPGLVKGGYIKFKKIPADKKPTDSAPAPAPAPAADTVPVAAVAAAAG